MDVLSKAKLITNKERCVWEPRQTTHQDQPQSLMAKREVCGSHDKQRTKISLKVSWLKERCVGATTNNAPRSASKSHG
jgi:hypothetical protein